jgi:hypothetical protein
MNDAWIDEIAPRTANGERRTDAADDPQSSSPQRDLAASIWKELETAGKQLSDIGKNLTSTTILTTLRAEAQRIIASDTFKSILDSVAAAAKSSDKTKSEWVVALNLTTDFDHNKDGKFDRLEDLKAFADKTKGKSLAIVVQAAFREPKADGSDEPTKYRLERYVVKDGAIRRVSVGPSKGYAQDLEDLVQYTSHQVPGNKMALIMDSHGIGNEGLLGDTGRITVPAFVQRVQGGLKDSGREKLDLIDFDACLMAQNGVLARMRPISNNIVASAELEPAKGISLIPPFQHLADKPTSTARDFARDLVNDARMQTDAKIAKGERFPIRTIAHLDLKEYDAFHSALDEFGDKLAESLKSPANRRTIERIIDSTLRYSLNEWDDTPQADIRDFAERVISAIDDGRLPDDSRQLKRSAQKAVNKLGDLVDAFYGYKDFRTTGGVSVFLPTWEQREEKWSASERTAAGRIMHCTAAKEYDYRNKTEADRLQFIKNIDAQLIRMAPLADNKKLQSELQEFNESYTRYKDARDEKARREAFGEMHDAAVRLENTPPCRKEYRTELEKIEQRTDKEFEAQLVGDTSAGWHRFQYGLCKDRKPLATTTKK